MSPQVFQGLQYSQKTDVWSVGVVFINLMIVDYFDLQPASFQCLDPMHVPIPNSDFEQLRDCVCSQMIVLREDQRGTVGDVIENEAFRNHFHLVEAKATAWDYEQAFADLDWQQWQQKVADLNRQVEESKNTNEVINSQLISRQRENDELKQEVEILKGLVTDLCGQMKSLQGKFDEKVAELTCQIEKSKQLQNACSSQLVLRQHENTVLKQELATLKSEFADLRTKQCSKEEEIEALKEQLANNNRNGNGNLDGDFEQRIKAENQQLVDEMKKAFNQQLQREIEKHNRLEEIVDTMKEKIYNVSALKFQKADEN